MLLSFRLSLILMFMGALAISTGPVFARFTDLPPLTISFYRVAFALIPILFQLLYTKKTVNRITRFTVIYSTVSGICLGCDIMLFYISINYTSVANAIILVNLAPVIVFFYDKYTKKQNVHFLVWICLIFIICGIVLIMGHKASLHNFSLWGELLAFGAALFYAAYLIIAQKSAKHCSGTTQSNLCITLGAIIVCYIACFSFSTDLTIASYSSLTFLLANAFIAQFFAQFCILRAMQSLPLYLSSLQLLLQPVFVTLLGWYFCNESIAKMQSIGMILIVSATYIISYHTLVYNKKILQ